MPHTRNPLFTGREDVLEKLREAFSSGGTAALNQPQAISGLGGIGKTQTAIEYAYRCRDMYEAVLWAQAESCQVLVSDFVAIAGVLNLREKDDQDHNLVVAAVKQWLEKNGNWLLVFDNADDPKLIDDFLPINPNGDILLTSRAQVFDNLGIVTPIELETLPPNDAKEFVVKRTGRSELDMAEVEAIEQLTQELEYLPLALEQAGAYIVQKKCSFKDYLSSYRYRGLKLLENSGPVIGKYRKSVATTWSLNFEQVQKGSSGAADLLRVSAFLYPEKIPLELIALGAPELGPFISKALVDARNDPLALDELLEPITQYSLVRRNLGLRTYSIHRLVQQVLKDEMEAAMQQQWAERVVRAVARAFPDIEFTTRILCERMIPHALVCAKLVGQWEFAFLDAAFLLNETGLYLYDRVRYAEAEAMYKKSLAILEKTLDSELLMPAILNHLAGLYLAQSRYPEAEPLFQQALAIERKVLEPEHPDIAITLSNLALVYKYQGRYEDAEPLFQQALDIQEKALGPEHPNIAITLNNMAWLYTGQGRYKDAEPLLQRALDIQEKALEPEHPDIAITLSNLGSLYNHQGRYKDAEPLLQQALDIQKEVLRPEDPRVVANLDELALLYTSQGRYSDAEALFHQALEMRKRAFGPEHPDIATSVNNLEMAQAVIKALSTQHPKVNPSIPKRGK